MKKSLIALAVAGTFAAPAFAATANVDISGALHMSVDSTDGVNAAKNGNDRNTQVSSNSSNIIFKGTEDLGGGLKGLWQVQTYFSAGGTGNTDTFNGSAADGVSSGNTFVGLSGGFGTVVLGKHEAPFKLVGRKVDLFGDQVGDNRNLVSKGSTYDYANIGTGTHGGEVVSTANPGWDLRPNNTIAYMTPAFQGFQGAIAYVANATGGNLATDRTPDALSASVTYTNGPLFVGLGYERHNLSDLNAVHYFSGVTAKVDDETAWRLSAGYTFGDLKLVALYQKEDGLTYAYDDNSTGTGTPPGPPSKTFDALDDLYDTDADRTVWGLGAAYAMGPITLKAQYYKADDIGNSTNSGAKMWALGADYALSKRTMVYAAYANTDNDTHAAYSVTGGGHGDNAGTYAGKDTDSFSVGIKHTF